MKNKASNHPVRPKAQAARLTLASHQYVFREGQLWAISHDLARPALIAVAPKGEQPRPGATLVITSERIETVGSQLYTECSWCREFRPLARAGLRTMPDGTIRSQPRCGPCRRPNLDPASECELPRHMPIGTLPDENVVRLSDAPWLANDALAGAGA